MLQNEGTFLGLRNTPLYFQSWHPEKPAHAVIIGVHGHGDHSGGLSNIINYLVPQGYIWYGFDLRGHGRSSGPRGYIHTWADFRSDLNAFVSKVKQQEESCPVYLLGHSLGGLISLEYALRYPNELNGLIAVSPALSVPGFPPLRPLLARALSFLRPGYTIEPPTDYHQLTRDDQIIKLLAADRLRHEKITARLGSEVLKSQEWVMAQAHRLQVPLLMLYGLKDSITPAEGNRQFYDAVVYRRKERQEYDLTPHRPFDDVNRTEFLAHLSAWLERQNNFSSPQPQLHWA